MTSGGPNNIVQWNAQLFPSFKPTNEERKRRLQVFALFPINMESLHAYESLMHTNYEIGTRKGRFRRGMGTRFRRAKKGGTNEGSLLSFPSFLKAYKKGGTQSSVLVGKHSQNLEKSLAWSSEVENCSLSREAGVMHTIGGWVAHAMCISTKRYEFELFFPHFCVLW